jgi:hypothetical protein
VVVPKIIRKVSDASGFVQFVIFNSGLSCQKHRDDTELNMKGYVG